MSNPGDISEGLSRSHHMETPFASARGARFATRLIPALHAGRLTIILPSGQPLHVVGREQGPSATLAITRWRALRRLALGGDVGFAEAYIDGDWTSPDLVALIGLVARNMSALNRTIGGMRLVRLVERLRHMLRGNSRRGSRRNIVAHYDLGNAFYRQWIGETMQYSSAIFANDTEALETAQARKLARIAALLRLDGGESVLEIGCGWGGLATRLAADAGARVTALTLSPAQRRWAHELTVAEGLEGRVDVRLQDYRDVEGCFDRIVSIEMFEAVGEAWWPAYFRVIAERLKPGGYAVLQVITIDDARYDAYRRTPDFIQKHIFPGGFLPSSTALAAQIAAAGLRLTHRETFGASYARTLAHWRSRFEAKWPDISTQGFDTRFQRLWSYYLSYCEAGFAQSAIDVGLYVIEHRDT